MKGKQGFQNGNTLWNHPKVIKNRFTKGHIPANFNGGKLNFICIECNIKFHSYLGTRKRIKKFCSVICHGKWKSKNRVGEKSPFWKGGRMKNYSEYEQIRKSVEHRQWSKKILKRDNYTCQICGDNSGGNLQANHIKKFIDYPHLRFELNNGISLCKNCHIGLVTSHEKEWEPYLNFNLVTRGIIGDEFISHFPLKVDIALF